MCERGGKYDPSAPLVPLTQDSSANQLRFYSKIARCGTYLAVILLILPALFDTTSRALGGNWRTVLAHVTGISPLRGSLRAAPIAWSRFHSGLWLGRSIIVCQRGHRASSCQTRRPEMESTLAVLFGRHLMGCLHPQTGPGAFPVSLSPPRGPSANVSLLPDMKFSRITGLKVPSLYKPHKFTQKTKPQSKNFL